MKRISLLLISLSLAILPYAGAQTAMDKLLLEVETNNATLAALAKALEADKLANRTGISLENPQVEYNYLWLNPRSLGSRHEISISQSFDVATVGGYKRATAAAQNSLLDIQWREQRMQILLEAKLLALDLIYSNALAKELTTRLLHAQGIAKAQKKRLDAGAGNRLEYNNAALNLATIETQVTAIETERTALLGELTLLNGGKPIHFDETDFPSLPLPFPPDEWFAQMQAAAPAFTSAQQLIAVRESLLRLARAECLPAISLGYAGEIGGEEQAHGFRIGLSIPLWSGVNRTKQAEAALRAAERQREATTLQLDAQLRNQLTRVRGLDHTATTLRDALAASNNADLLRKALDCGEIDLLTYWQEMRQYYEVLDQMLSTLRDQHKAYAQLTAYLL